MAQQLDHNEIITSVETTVRTALEGNDASHDWAHIERVRDLALRIAVLEGLSEEQRFAVELGALLHDLKDWKYAAPGAHLDSHTLACDEVKVRFALGWRRGQSSHLAAAAAAQPDPKPPLKTHPQALLPPLGVPAPTIDRVCEIIARIGFKDELPSANGEQPPPQPLSLEARVVQDADRCGGGGCGRAGGRVWGLVHASC